MGNKSSKKAATTVTTSHGEGGGADMPSAKTLTSTSDTSSKSSARGRSISIDRGSSSNLDIGRMRQKSDAMSQSGWSDDDSFDASVLVQSEERHHTTSEGSVEKVIERRNTRQRSFTGPTFFEESHTFSDVNLDSEDILEQKQVKQLMEKIFEYVMRQKAIAKQKAEKKALQAYKDATKSQQVSSSSSSSSSTASVSEELPELYQRTQSIGKGGVSKTNNNNNNNNNNSNNNNNNKHLPQHLLTPHRSNSTSTLFVDSTLKNPDIDQVIRSVARVLHYHIIMDGQQQSVVELITLDIFDERKYPISNKKDFSIPEVEMVYAFIKAVYTSLQSSIETTVISLIYMERFKFYTSLEVNAYNWRWLFIAGYLLSLKVWDECATWNVDFCSLFPKLNVKDLNNLEREFLNSIHFNVTIKTSIYAKWYYELRSLYSKTEANNDSDQLDAEGAKKLELRGGVDKMLLLRRTSDGKIHAKKNPFFLS